MGADTRFDLGGYEPVQDAHAIQACRVTIACMPMTMPADREARLKQLVGSAPLIGRALNYGIPAPSYGVTINVDQNQIIVGHNRARAPNNQIMGFEFTKLNGEGVAAERFSVNEDALQFVTFEYIRWKPFLAHALNSFNEAKKHIDYANAIDIRLEYWDRFVCRTPDVKADASKLFRKSSPYIARDAFDKHEAWHCHVGRFLKTREKYRTLINTRVDIADLPDIGNLQTRSASIYTSVSYNLNAEYGVPLKPILDSYEVSDIFQKQHVHSKKMLADIISPAAADRLSLNGDQNVSN